MTQINFPTLLGVSWFFTAVALALTAGRFWIRSKILRRLDWDDAAHLLGFIFLLTQVAMVTREITMLDDLNNLSVAEWEHSNEVTFFYRIDFAATLVTWCCLYSIKASFLLLYRRIFQISFWFTRAWWTVSAIVFISFWIVVAASATQCGDASQIDNFKACVAPDKVERQKAFVIWSCPLNILTDVIIMALPLMMVKGLKLRKPAKWSLAGVFSLVFFIIAFDILRTVETLYYTDTEGNGSTAFWTNLETAVAVIVSSLPSFVALLTRKKESVGRTQSPYHPRSLAVFGSEQRCVDDTALVKDGRRSEAYDLERRSHGTETSRETIERHHETV